MYLITIATPPTNRYNPSNGFNYGNNTNQQGVLMSTNDELVQVFTVFPFHKFQEPDIPS